jgi:predicted nucleic acid-binding protein
MIEKKGSERVFHIVYLVRVISSEREKLLAREVGILESLGHRVTVVCRKRRSRASLERALAKSGAALCFIRESDPWIHVHAIPTHLALVMRGPFRYRRLLRIARESVPQVTFRRFLHAGIIARRMERNRADHLHFLSGNSRIARLVSSFCRLSYSFTTDPKDATRRDETRRAVQAGVRYDPAALELLVRVTETARITDNASTTPHAASDPDDRPRRTSISGQLENLPLPEIVQILNRGAKTACVTMVSRSGQGKIWFRDGAIVHARLGAHEGEAAFFHMLRFKVGEFSIQHGVEAHKQTVENDTMFLVFEGLRRIDEGRVADAAEVSESG